MVTYIWVNIGAGCDVVPEGIEPLPEPMLTYHQLYSVAFNNSTRNGHEYVIRNYTFKISTTPKGQFIQVLQHIDTGNKTIFSDIGSIKYFTLM